ncbi:hypothetical protein H8356DRAFT_1356271 [Neocallimastix lanati (nom. inval.)]|nr:hypothetical protein H8356DRAFT_1356271 [Neocallimastix sp. JGI-2020a]
MKLFVNYKLQESMSPLYIRINTELIERVVYMISCVHSQRSTRRSSTSKILSNNMHVRVPILKHSVRSSSRDNSTFIKRKCVTTSIFLMLLKERG